MRFVLSSEKWLIWQFAKDNGLSDDERKYLDKG
jgi:hypothetical protein